jgi:hypothetical protein
VAHACARSSRTGLRCRPKRFCARRKIPLRIVSCLLRMRCGGLKRRAPGLDRRRGDVLQQQRPEDRDEHAVHGVAVVDHRRRLAGAVLDAVAEPLGPGALEGHPGTDHAGQRSGMGLGEHVGEPGFGAAPIDEPVVRPPRLRPRRSDLLLHLPPVRQPVLREPHRPTSTIHAEHMPTDWAGPIQPDVRHQQPLSRDISGTRPLLQGWRENERNPANAGLLVSAPTRNRT